VEKMFGVAGDRKGGRLNARVKDLDLRPPTAPRSLAVLTRSANVVDKLHSWTGPQRRRPRGLRRRPEERSS